MHHFQRGALFSEGVHISGEGALFPEGVHYFRRGSIISGEGGLFPKRVHYFVFECDTSNLQFKKRLALI